MEEKLSKVAQTLKPSPIQELSHLSQRCNAINLAEGFPDFPAPIHIKEAAISAINSDFNQYRHVQGICKHLAEKMKLQQGLDVNPLTDIAICCGQTEAFAAAVFATIDKGDEVLLFDPTYETYETCILMAGGIPVYVSLDPPHWTLDRDKLMKSVTSRTKAVVLNSPHNPTGKVFSKDELEAIAGVCRDMDCLAITDEVYEYITFDMEKHISLASILGMQERTIITSSLSKTFSVTGWRIGWAIAPACIASALRNIHVKITDSAPAPFQEAALTALTCSPEYYESLRRAYESKRDYIVKMLCSVGFKIQFKPQGSFFVFAELPEECILSDIDFVTELIRKAGVAAVPGCGFFHSNFSSPGLSLVGQNYQRRYIRFAFCKNDATLEAAAQKIGKLVDGEGCLKL
ncbi:probable N-succinyldiaminopimelate aminotransferase DapC isoform X1 [Macadamia integrifolia]|uniref:probable N-succinyldiaminopimelate aminotransferase DapC isoform X1 n=1 Tax=Macadamia integrifolia TaxID=60698 RepID=UPI001C4E8A47|nr:probable N-succinyldiaminopimelate aminotransferase DapC isoform X1 [Macadamia integrifolia]